MLKANLQGISATIHFENAFERSYSTLYDVLDVSPFVVATVSRLYAIEFDMNVSTFTISFLFHKIGVYDSSSSQWLHDLIPLRDDVKRPGRYRRQLTQCGGANGVFRVTTMKVSKPV